MIETKALSFAHAGQQQVDYPDIKLPAGQSLLVSGKSGSGKTTLLHLLSGLLPLQQGEVIINGKKLTELSSRQLDVFRGQQIGLILQQHYFVQSLSAGENIKLASFLSEKKLDENWYKELVEKLGIQKLLLKMPAQLSTGEQQRVSIARALLNRPALVLADEPTSSLDDDNSHTVAQLLKTLCSEIDTALVIVTHDNRLHADFKQQIILA